MSNDTIANFFQLDKRVYIEFVNADMDGQLLDSDTGPPLIRHFVKLIFVSTEGGQVGKNIVSIPFSKALDYLNGNPIDDQYLPSSENCKSLNHNYTIVKRLEEGNEVWLQVRHSVRPPDAPPDTPSS